MLDLIDYFQEIKLPIATVQYDSWWYYKGGISGIKLWEPMPSTLGGPAVNGEPSTWLNLPTLPTVLHSRFYQSDNEYILGTAPGLPADWKNWSWYIDTSGADGVGIGVSYDERFFGHIFDRVKEGLSMATYEQDFLARQYESCAALQSEPGAGKKWLGAMSAAAESTNVTIQYCMALPRHILQSAAFPRVTHARASHDYGQSRSDDTEQWSPIGLTSLLYWSIGLLPFKDDFWSEIDQPGNHWNAKEADPELQTLVSSLIAGPVGPADGIGMLNRTRVMQTCREDGILLKPHGPAMNLDSTFAAALADTKAPGASSYIGIPSIWGTTISANTNSLTNGNTNGYADKSAPPIHHLLLFANVSTAGYSVEVSELQGIEAEALSSPDLVAQFDTETALKSPATSFVGREYYTGELRVVDSSTPLHVAHAPKPAACAHLGLDKPLGMYCIPFELWSLAPLPAAGGWLVLGEVDKYIGVSGQRFQGLTSNAGSLSAKVLGSPKEVVSVAMLDCRAAGSCVSAAKLPVAVVVSCTLGANGGAVLQCGANCACA
jgi:hypothetical protein